MGSLVFVIGKSKETELFGEGQTGKKIIQVSEVDIHIDVYRHGAGEEADYALERQYSDQEGLITFSERVIPVGDIDEFTIQPSGEVLYISHQLPE